MPTGGAGEAPAHRNGSPSVIEHELFAVHQRPDDVFPGDLRVVGVFVDIRFRQCEFFSDRFAGIDPAVELAHTLFQRT